MKIHYLKRVGSYIGLVIGICMNTLLFGVFYSIAQAGKFEPWGILLFFVFPIIGFIIGGIIQKKYYEK